MSNVGGNAGAKTLGHCQTDRVFNIAAEKRPGAADGRLAAVDAATAAFSEKCATPVLPCAYFQLSARAFAIAGSNLSNGNMEKGSQAGKIGGTDDNAAPAFAAYAALAALKDSVFLSL